MQQRHGCGEIISYSEMCNVEGMSLQHGMNFRGDDSVFLMSTRRNAPYDDSIDNENLTIIYEGHDLPMTNGVSNPKLSDQPILTPSGKATRNKKFFDTAEAFERGDRKKALIVHIYQNLRVGIWVYNGPFLLERAT